MLHPPTPPGSLKGLTVRIVTSGIDVTLWEGSVGSPLEGGGQVDGRGDCPGTLIGFFPSVNSDGFELHGLLLRPYAIDSCDVAQQDRAMTPRLMKV